MSLLKIKIVKNISIILTATKKIPFEEHSGWKRDNYGKFLNNRAE